MNHLQHLNCEFNIPQTADAEFEFPLLLFLGDIVDDSAPHMLSGLPHVRLNCLDIGFA